MAGTRVDKRVERGQHSRRAILGRAMDVASVEGLESLSVRRLAAELDLSKSGVFAQFGSKEELQLATVRAAVEVYVDKVVKPANRTPAGIGRVRALCESWLAYAREPVFPGGCFFLSVSAEFDARPGRVRDAVASARRDWQRLYEATIEQARGLGEVRQDTDAAQLAFELDALARGGGQDALLHDDSAIYERVRVGLLARLRAVATDPGLLD
ncbi:TetR/AcrR family transcriptional regulator [Prauserella cavernicola]|uniref:TetR/AcrR family transcriptional regulator n=1 Tax=Prauserella cavernicola TaxID=2800127 RepID=A0A934V2D6_9PSEU|nr:TetR/AcrR family transcriptional regulator [Prauserella cavernicola]MBK1785471.1 TetR/AcrR family transcriptional regulator [Prauserella cavernicola]